jgi:uncharacterized membrane protein (UPF0127 family)
MKAISKKVKICDSLFSKGFGLMFTKKRSDFAYVFDFPKPKMLAVTMVFVFYPIDVIFLDSKGVIVEHISGLKPFRNYFVKNKIKTFIEFPKGFIKKYHLKNGLKMQWSDKQVTIL